MRITTGREAVEIECNVQVNIRTTMSIDIPTCAKSD